MNNSFPFRLYSGLLTKEHRKRIGSALWEFLWCIDKTTKEITEEGKVIGLVLGGKPIKLLEIADDLGGDKSTIKRNIDKLEREGYLRIIRAPYGLVIHVLSSKKWVKRSVANSQREPNKRKFSVVKMQRRKIKALGKRLLSLQNSNARCKNAHSNKDNAIDNTKDIKKISAVDNKPLQKRNGNNVIDFATKTGKEGVPLPRKVAIPSTSESDANSGQRKISESEYRESVTQKYIIRRENGVELRNNDWDALNELISLRIPLTTVLEGIDKAFDEHKPKHSRDKINSLKYCVPIICDLNYQKQAELEAKKQVPASFHDELATEKKAEQQSPSCDQDEFQRLLAEMKSC